MTTVLSLGGSLVAPDGPDSAFLSSFMTLVREHLAVAPEHVPGLADLPPGCPFHPRCPYAKPGLCDVGAPPRLETLEADHAAGVTHLAEETGCNAERLAVVLAENGPEVDEKANVGRAGVRP